MKLFAELVDSIDRTRIHSLLLGHYDKTLVLLSLIIAITSSYTALHLAARTFVWNGKTRLIWLASGGIAMGIGIWAMHYVGMLAFRLPLPTRYDLPTVFVSLLAAIFASIVSLYVVSRAHLNIRDLLMGSLAMGVGISAMHYIGMAALRMPARCHYDPAITAASVLIAILVSGISLRITFRLRENTARPSAQFVSAMAMGIAIAAMHYTGMAAATFHQQEGQKFSALSVSTSSLNIGVLAVAVFLILLAALASSFADRYLSLQRARLAKSQIENRLLSERNLAAVCRTSIEGKVIDLNEAAVTLYGLGAKEDVLGMNIGEFYSENTDREHIIGELKKRGFINGAEICLKRKDGSFTWVLCNLTLLKNPESGNLEILTTATDVSALKTIQQELIFAREQAEQASLVKSRFVANMSHELRTPLNGILGTLSLAFTCQLSDEVRSYLEICKLSADSLMSIINDVLDFSKIEAAKLKLDIHEFDFRKLVDDAVRVLSIPAAQKQLRLVLDCAESVPQTMIGDSVRLRQVIFNLVGNAIKFTPQGSVTLSVNGRPQSASEVQLSVSVRDTGVGIPPDKTASIFEAFAQADSSDSRRFGGTGLGLAISSELVRAMGGSLSVESTVGVGSTFQFTVILGLPKHYRDATDESFDPASELSELAA